uniref:Two-pore potassium channel 1-like n=1 Tax=Tanacetum cinerariifolium TaxID=118510 RepID=A0A699HSC5_TANCI|nr:two-pore potassium channel 1-like [Tanacetum cinerariifolium]
MKTKVSFFTSILHNHFHSKSLNFLGSLPHFIPKQHNNKSSIYADDSSSTTQVLDHESIKNDKFNNLDHISSMPMSKIHTNINPKDHDHDHEHVHDQDDVWLKMKDEARYDIDKEPILSNYYTSSILSHDTIESELLFTYSELHIEMRQKELVKWILQRKITTADMDAADLDADGFVCRSEYVLYKLKELGVITQEDVLPIMEDFKRLDSKIVAPPQQDVDISMEEIYASELQNVAHRPHQKWRHHPLSPPRNFSKENSLPPPRSMTAFEYKKAGVILLIYLGAGTISFYLVRHQISGTKTNGIIDALYLTVVLLTCVGYGDLSPDTTLTILIATFFSLFGILLILLVLSITAQLLVQKQEVLMTNVLNLHQTVDATKLQTRVEFNTARKKCVLLVVMLVAIIAVGAVVLVRVEDLDFIHALYCVLATIIGVGSDRCFSTIGGRVFALFWMLSGTIYLGELLFRFTELLTQWRRRPSAECAVKTKPMDAQMVEAADMDDDGVIKASEYVIHILLETGKISQEDMAPILKQFDTLDVDNKRKLALCDAMYRQTYV